MLNKEVSQFIAAHDLLSLGDTHLIALSGGADSVCLLLVLRRLGYQVEAAHCNFHLRGDESNRDEQFCIDLCRRHAIPLHLAHFDTRAYADLHKVSIEMAARDLRYGYFEQLRFSIGAATVCVAHHREDSVETVLLNLIRGTGIDGLTGIAPRNGHVVRPLLSVSRRDIEEWLSEQGEGYVTDSTNLVNDVKRNKVRLDVIPLLQTINPSVVDSIYQTSLRLTEAARMANSPVIHDRYQGDTLPFAMLRSEASAEYVLWHRLAPLGFTPAQVEDMAAAIDGRPGMEWQSSTHIVVTSRDALVIAPLEPQAPQPVVMPEAGTYLISSGERLKVKLASYTPDMPISRDPLSVMLDATAVELPLTLRRVRQGDRFTPLGMRGSKLVSDYLTDRKRNLIEKRRQLVVTDARDRVVWLVGERPDHRCRITADTRRYIQFTYIRP